MLRKVALGFLVSAFVFAASAAALPQPPSRFVPPNFVDRVANPGRQEFYKDHAEDHFRVLDLNAAVTTPYVSSHAALLTREWTPLEPGVIDHKLYVRGVGTVREETVKGANELTILVSVRHG